MEEFNCLILPTCICAQTLPSYFMLTIWAESFSLAVRTLCYRFPNFQQQHLFLQNTANSSSSSLYVDTTCRYFEHHPKILFSKQCSPSMVWLWPTVAHATSPVPHTHNEGPTHPCREHTCFDGPTPCGGHTRCFDGPPPLAEGIHDVIPGGIHTMTGPHTPVGGICAVMEPHTGHTRCDVMQDKSKNCPPYWWLG